jgi:hypothetical protein
MLPGVEISGTRVPTSSSTRWGYRRYPVPIINPYSVAEIHDFSYPPSKILSFGINRLPIIINNAINNSGGTFIIIKASALIVVILILILLLVLVILILWNRGSR